MNAVNAVNNTPKGSPHRREFDYTMLNTFCTCPRKYDYRINRGLVKKVPHTAPAFGGAIHKALDEWFQSRDIVKAVEIFKDEFTEQPDVDTKRTHEMGEWILKNYATQYASQPWKVLSTEQEFCLPLPNGNNFIGRIDKIIEWDSTVWVVDHKTTSGIGKTTLNMANPNAQFTGYVWAARQMGYKASGIILDFLLVASGLLESSRRARLTPTLRYDSYRTDKAIEEWQRECIKIQKDIEECECRGDWPAKGMFHGACTYFGTCPFHGVCSEDDDLRERLLEADFDVEFWDPRKED